MNIHDLDEDGPPELVSIEPDTADDSARPKSPADIKLPRVPITIVTGIHSSRPVEHYNPTSYRLSCFGVYLC